MKRKDLKVLIGFLFISLFSTNVFSQKTTVESPAQMVKTFYAFHRTHSNTFNKTGIDARKKWFSATLYNLLLNELKLEKEYLKQNPTDKPFFGDGFPFQPFDECLVNGKSYFNSYQIGAATINENTAAVEVKFYEPKQCGGKLIDTYKTELVKINGKWLIEDWICADNKRLTTDLKTPHY